jgi:hypothetical protein
VESFSGFESALGEEVAAAKNDTDEYNDETF